VIWELLKEEGCNVHFHDVHVPVITDPGHHTSMRGEKSVELSPEVLKRMDLIIVVTHHRVRGGECEW
jgi:UDP-N-acetyl-D-mannosaminuronate dehydrogenase